MKSLLLIKPLLAALVLLAFALALPVHAEDEERTYDNLAPVKDARVGMAYMIPMRISASSSVLPCWSPSSPFGRTGSVTRTASARVT